MLNKILILLITFLFFSLLSCDDKPGESPKSENTIKFWHFWSEPNQRVAIKSLVEQFEAENNCKVEMTELSWGDGKTKLFAAFNAGNPPDVLELGSDWVAQFSSSGVLKQLRDDEMGIENFIEFSLNPAYYETKLYALPWIVDTRVLFYNTDLVNLDEASLSDINKITAEASVINEQKGIYGWGANGSDRHRLYKKIVSMIWSYGGDILDCNNKPVFNSKESALALDKYAELSRIGLIETQRQIDAAFVDGKVAFWISGGWLLEKIKNENPNLNYKVMTVPGVNGNQGISFAGGEYLAVSNNSQNTELSEKFVRFMTDGKNSIEFCKQVIEAGFPADKNYYNDEFYSTQPDRLIFAKQLESARMTPVHPKWLEIEEILEDAAVQVIYGKMSAKDALINAEYKVKELMK
ncbi:MAG: extracellular solute-binding protein [Candidatus Kapabacteria bacterium]|nr:extracellular solute-binding protein [Ignavibacteriota bacterium]MCW5885224.1 extracellular solute-binding protein [Candidatus Kapabacteria bacterium]